MGESRILRQRVRDTGDALDRLGERPTGTGPMLVQVYAATTVPTGADKYFACHPVSPGGPEGEGNTPTFTADTASTVYVLVVGSKVPVAGDYLIARPVGGRWVADAGTRGECVMVVQIVRTNFCPTGGAHVDIKLGGTIVHSDDIPAGLNSITWPDSVPGTTYTVEWSYFSSSGSFTAVACSTTRVDIATPTGVGLTVNCIDPVVNPIYVTDRIGTRQIYPPPADCVFWTGGPFALNNQYYQSSLIAEGTCLSPTWRLATSRYFNFAGACTTVPNATSENTFSMSCARPFSYSGTYPSGHMFFGGGPTDSDFLIHE